VGMCMGVSEGGKEYMLIQDERKSLGGAGVRLLQ
jgi:hypothetical protein